MIDRLTFLCEGLESLQTILSPEDRLVALIFEGKTSLEVKVNAKVDCPLGSSDGNWPLGANLGSDLQGLGSGCLKVITDMVRQTYLPSLLSTQSVTCEDQLLGTRFSNQT